MLVSPGTLAAVDVYVWLTYFQFSSVQTLRQLFFVKLPLRHATLALAPRLGEHQRHIGTITLPTHVPPRLRIVLPEPAEGAKLQRQLWPVLCTHLL